MALRPCPHCGHLISPRATTCLHCGQNTTTPPQETAPNAASTDASVAPTLCPCPQCGHLTSVRAKTCIKCGASLSPAPSSHPTQHQAPTAPPPPYVTEDYLTYEKPRSKKGLIITLVLLFWVTIIAIAGFLFRDNIYRYIHPDPVYFDTLTTTDDSTDVQPDTTDHSSALNAGTTTDNSPHDTTEHHYQSSASAEDVFDKPHRPEDGFRSNDDVRRFVEDNTYWRNGLSLRIESCCIYAGDNDIATSSPTFKRVSNNVGLITARPNISITVRRTSNTLVDNRSGEVYRLNRGYATTSERPSKHYRTRDTTYRLYDK